MSSATRRFRWHRSSALATILALAAGCSSLGYTLQTLAGGASLLARRQPVERVLARHDLAPGERAALELATELRAFAVRELSLPDGGSYRSYVRTGRDAVVWNVVAAPPFSLEPVEWCFPIVGCVAYRGYFDEARARRFAERLTADGFDVVLGGVDAYSTLGWFDDPLLDTFLDQEPYRLAGLIFHELAHQVVWTEDDTAFNESFASAVEELGIERWLATRSASGRERAAWMADRRSHAWLDAALRAARADLEPIYSGTAAESARRSAKADRLALLAAEIGRALDSGDLDPSYAALRDRRWNNAALGANADYSTWVPAFRALHAAGGGSFPELYRAANELARRPRAKREAALRLLTESPAD